METEDSAVVEALGVVAVLDVLLLPPLLPHPEHATVSMTVPTMATVLSFTGESIPLS